MSYQTVIVAEIPHGITVTINRVSHRNSINKLLLTELHTILEQAEKNDDYKVIVLRGQQNLFCTGIDFTEIIDIKLAEAGQLASQYNLLLKRLTLLPKITIALVEGQAMAGGIGLLAACDFVISSSNSQFTLSEVLWGLLPANVLPYLIRRVGFQQAYFLTLSAQTLSATEALTIHLIDFMTENVDELLQKQILRFARLEIETIKDLKHYFRKLSFIDDNIEQLAVTELTRLIQQPRVQNHIKRFLQQGILPWEGLYE